MTIIYLDKKDNATKRSVYSNSYVRIIEFPMQEMWAVILPAQYTAKGCNSYTVHKSPHAAARKADKYRLAGVPCIIIDDWGRLYEGIASRKGGANMMEINGRFYGVEPIGERLADITIDRLRCGR